MVHEGRLVESGTMRSSGRPRGWWLLILVSAAAGISGCAVAPAATLPPAATTPPPSLPALLPTWPVPPEQLADPTSGTGEALLTCGGRTFPAAGLNAPSGAEKASGPEFDALRATLAMFADAFQGSSTWTWRLAGRDDTGAIFLSKPDQPGTPGWIALVVTADASGWKPGGMGDCDPHIVLSAEFGPATWELDPAFPTPAADTSEVHILVWERACSGGSPATGRISAPVVQYAATTVTITIGVRPPDAPPGTAFTCPLGPGTPAIMRLGEPLGNRTLLDGGVVPPAPPSAP